MASSSPAQHDAFDLARRAVEHAANDGGQIAATTTANEILRLLPDVQLTAAEIENEIVRHAVRKGVVVQLG